MLDLIHDIGYIHKLDEYFEYHINPAGPWENGGFESDAGLTGRKIAVDNYGPQVEIGGGAFSGKDYTKVDRSGAYMARWLALHIIHNWEEYAGAGTKTPYEIKVKLAYAIGVNNPVMVSVQYLSQIQDRIGFLNCTNKINQIFDLSPSSIRDFLKLREVEYYKTAQSGHFGKIDCTDFPWECNFKKTPIQILKENDGLTDKE